jgi:L-alanine-DL-glutamate epimerase-like enolase superfamily enzyme
MSRIAAVEVIPVASPGQAQNDLDGTLDTVIVRLTDEEGRTGIGEADGPPDVIKAFIEMPTAHLWSRNASEILLRADPVETAVLWRKLYDVPFWAGRRAWASMRSPPSCHGPSCPPRIANGLPASPHIGIPRRERLRPYCTIYPGLSQGRPVSALMAEIGRQFEAALATGFRAVKMEVLFYDLVTDAELVGLIKQGRRMLGDGILMALDFGYRWSSWHDAKWVLDRVADCDIYFAEATLQHDDLAGHARLAAQSAIRICGAEAAATRFEIREWPERGGVAVVQRKIGRGGGLTEIRRIADLCELHGAQVIPHGWKTGITSAVGRHFQAACPAAPLFEFISPQVFDSPLRRELVSPEPVIVDGFMELPTAPGLGIELNEELVERWRTDRR